MPRSKFVVRNPLKISGQFFSFRRLLKSTKKKSGRSNNGIITSYYRGGGYKRHYRLIDFKRILWNISAVLLRFEYDPFRSTFISFICYQNGLFSYISASEGTKIGQRLYMGWNFYKYTPEFSVKLIKAGNTLRIKDIPEGYTIHFLERKAGEGIKFVRSAGAMSKLLRHLNNRVSLVRLPSREQYLFDGRGICTIGQASNLDNKIEKFKNAGVRRRLGFRPRVRGVAMNPIDHPHGGGEGRSTGGRGSKCSVNAWSNVAKGKPTRSNLEPFRKTYIHLSRKDKSIDRSRNRK